MLSKLSLHWDLRSQRRDAWRSSRRNAFFVHEWLVNAVPDEELAMLGLVRHAMEMTIGGQAGSSAASKFIPFVRRGASVPTVAVASS